MTRWPSRWPSGLTLVALVGALGHVSGAHLNPAVTLALAGARKFPWPFVPVYMGAQFAGAVVGALGTFDDTVIEILGQRQVFWITLGAAITVWEISGAMRAVMGVFSSIYGVADRRSFARRFLVPCAPNRRALSGPRVSAG